MIFNTFKDFSISDIKFASILRVWVWCSKVSNTSASESSDSDDYISGDESNSIVKQASSIFTMHPDIIKFSKSEGDSSAYLRARLEKLKNPPTRQRSSRLESRKQIEDCMKDIHWDFSNTSEKLDFLVRWFVSRSYAVLLRFSYRRFKTFLFKAKKNIRQKSKAKYKHLFINDNITSFNYSILITFKEKKRRRFESALTGFEAVYCFEGKVYVKKNRTADILCISEKNSSQFHKGFG